MKARFFATPTAVRQWVTIISPGSSEKEALEDMLDWSSDAERQDRRAPNGAAVYRARKPLRCYFLVDENERPLPAITGVLRPHSNWTPGQSAKGRPRSVSSPGEAHSEGQPEVRCRVPRHVSDWVGDQGAGWLCRLVLEAYRARTVHGRTSSDET